jgi:leucyl aminopeptidase
MADGLVVGFSAFATPAKGVLVVFCDESLKLGTATRRLLGSAVVGLVQRAAEADHFKGKSGTSLDLVAPAGLKVDRLVVIGCGLTAGMKSQDFVKLGGVAMGKTPSTASAATIVAELSSRAFSGEEAADLALGLRMRA